MTSSASIAAASVEKARAEKALNECRAELSSSNSHIKALQLKLDCFGGLDASAAHSCRDANLADARKSSVTDFITKMNAPALADVAIAGACAKEAASAKQLRKVGTFCCVWVLKVSFPPCLEQWWCVWSV